MGYDLNKFVDIQDIPTHLRCTICSLVLEDPLQAPLCEHYFCNQCITIHLQSTNHCPHHDEDSVSLKSDKKKSPLRKMSFRKIIGKSPKDKLPVLKLSDLKRLSPNTLDELNNLKVNCDFKLNGCKERLSLSALNDHVKQCKFIDEVNESSDTAEHKQTNTISSNSTAITAITKDSTNESKEPQSSVCEQTRVDQTNDMKDQEQRDAKRKDSENKSLNGETGSKLVSEEEVGSDDFVVIPKNSSSTKSTESVQTNGSDPAMISGESKENVDKSEKETDNPSVGDKKKKKKKKKKSTKQDQDAVSLDTASLKGDSADSEQGGSKTQSKESIAETEEMKRALREAETKCDNLRLINNQLLGQIKQMKEEKEELNKKLTSQLGNETELNELKSKIQQLEKENKSQALKIIQLLDNNDQMSKFIVTLRDEQSQLKERYNQTLSDVQQISKLMKTCKQEIK